MCVESVSHEMKNNLPRISKESPAISAKAKLFKDNDNIKRLLNKENEEVNDFYHPKDFFSATNILKEYKIKHKVSFK